LKTFYQKLKPSKTGMAQQLSERYIDDLDALNASLRSKYCGLDLSSSTEDIAAFAQNSERGLRLNLLFTEKVAVRQVRNFQTISLTSVLVPQETSTTINHVYQTANARLR
jgi:hypothetical protein